MRHLAITGMVTAAWMPSIIAGSLMRATPPSRRMSAGTRSSAITATAPASSAIFACSGVTTSMMTPPRSISASPRFTRAVPVVPFRSWRPCVPAGPDAACFCFFLWLVAWVGVVVDRRRRGGGRRRAVGHVDRCVATAAAPPRCGRAAAGWAARWRRRSVAGWVLSGRTHVPLRTTPSVNTHTSPSPTVCPSPSPAVRRELHHHVGGRDAARPDDRRRARRRSTRFHVSVARVPRLRGVVALDRSRRGSSSDAGAGHGGASAREVLEQRRRRLGVATEVDERRPEAVEVVRRVAGRLARLVALHRAVGRRRPRRPRAPAPR